MADRHPDAKDHSRRDYAVEWNGQSAQVHTETHLNFIEAQPQILSRQRQLRVVKGFVFAIPLAIIIWIMIAAFVF